MLGEKNLAKALATFDGMVSIVDAEMLVRGQYSTSKVEKPELAEQGAICGGRKFCAIGTMLVAYGVQPYEKPQEESPPYLTETDAWSTAIDTPDRWTFCAQRPALKAVHDALNEEVLASGKLGPGITHRMREPDYRGVSAIECLFESSAYYSTDQTGRQALKNIILAARQRVIDASPEAALALGEKPRAAEVAG